MESWVHKARVYREVVGLVVRLREQRISMERLKLERARFELDVADLVLKHIDRLKASGVVFSNGGLFGREVQGQVVGIFYGFEEGAHAVVVGLGKRFWAVE